MNKMINKTIDFDIAILRKSDIKTVDFDGEIAMMDIKKGIYYYVDSIGSEIWKVIQNPTTINEMVSQLILQYDIDEETCRNHVHGFILELINRDLALIFM